MNTFTACQYLAIRPHALVSNKFAASSIWLERDVPFKKYLLIQMFVLRCGLAGAIAIKLLMLEIAAKMHINNRFCNLNIAAPRRQSK